MTSSAHDQFDYFKTQLDAIHIDLIPMVDVERDDGKLREELQDSLKVFLNLLEKEYGKKAPIVTGPSHYAIWQYTENGSIPGIPKPVDICRMHPDFSINDIEL